MPLNFEQQVLWALSQSPLAWSSDARILRIGRKRFGRQWARPFRPASRHGYGSAPRIAMALGKLGKKGLVQFHQQHLQPASYRMWRLSQAGYKALLAPDKDGQPRLVTAGKAGYGL